MPDDSQSKPQRHFRCEHCHGLIRIPADLPATTAPCPHCGDDITSPGPGLHSDADPGTPHPALPKAAVTWEKGARIQDAGDDPEEKIQTKSPHMPALIGMAVVILAVVSGGLLVRQQTKKPTMPARDEAVLENDALRDAHYLRSGWKKDAYEVLDGFLKGTSAQQKMPYVMNAGSLAGTIRDFYGKNPVDDSDTPAEAFSAYELSDKDKERGLFMLAFDQPPQFSLLDFFRPLATLEVQYGLVEADMLVSSMARASNFATEPVRVHAFFRKTADGLKLDWETFAQTKYRLLANFLESPQIGSRKVFRVFVMEDIQHAKDSTSDTRTYRIADPANLEHSARIAVPVDSDVGRELSSINWLGKGERNPQSRTATMELEWRDDNGQPELVIQRLLCWEFLGLGGNPSTAGPTTTDKHQ